MHPPPESCRALYRLHKQLRLAWVGRAPKFEGEENPGSFAVVQLYHVRDAGSPDEPTSFREFWNTTMGFDEATYEFAPKRINRGPIFNRFGGTSLDYDPLVRVPIFAMTLDGEYTYPDGSPIQTQDVFSKKFLVAIAHNLSDVKKRVKDQRASFGRDVDRRGDDIGREMTDFLWREANRADSTRDTSITREDASAAMAKAQNRWVHRQSFSDCFEAPR